MSATRKVEVGGDCVVVWEQYVEGERGDVAIRYIEHATDHWSSNHQTDADIDEGTARSIVALLVAAFGPGVLPAPAADAVILTGPEVRALHEALAEADLSAGHVEGLAKRAMLKIGGGGR
jgi:hypothetical protein